jgi:hypothetical protein
MLLRLPQFTQNLTHVSTIRRNYKSTKRGVRGAGPPPRDPATPLFSGFTPELRKVFKTYDHVKC